MNGAGVLVAGLAGLAVVLVMVAVARLRRAVAEVRGLDVSASFEPDEDGG